VGQRCEVHLRVAGEVVRQRHGVGADDAEGVQLERSLRGGQRTRECWSWPQQITSKTEVFAKEAVAICTRNRGGLRAGAARHHLERLHDGPPGLLGEPVARLGSFEELHLKRVHSEPAAEIGLAVRNLAPKLRPIGELHNYMYRTLQKILISSQKLASPMKLGLALS
jgi:hypothetical protein